MATPPNTPSQVPTTTPLKPQYIPPSNSTKAAKVEHKLKEELRFGVFADHPGFIKTIFEHVKDSHIKDVLAQATNTERKLYDGKRWKYFPEGTYNEKELYEPFVEVANFIIVNSPPSPPSPQSTPPSPQSAPPSPLPWFKWISDPNRAPLTSDPKDVAFKPDIACTINCESRNVPWHCILVPMEVKKKPRKGVMQGEFQLLKYMLQTFKESIDRRFVFGIVLADTVLAVYLADCLGVLGSQTFDIHKDPESLIRVITGLATLSTSKLGWDPTMTIYDPTKDHHNRPSFESLSDMRPIKQWQLMMPHPTENQDEVFIIFAMISISRGEVIRGRATRVLHGWRLIDMRVPESKQKTFIIKDTWRDDERRLEGDMYAQIGTCQGIAKVHSSVIVQVDMDDDTTKRIRRDLFPDYPPRNIDAIIAAQESESTTMDSQYVPVYVMTDHHPTGPNADKHRPQSRTHSRLMLKVFGWPIHYAKSRLELVCTMRDAIAAHKYAYGKHVLHRDISTGNILITDRGGFLINFDNAIDMANYEPKPNNPLTGTRPFMSAEILGTKAIFNTGDAPLVRIPNAVHDLEGFFWVLVWIYIAREGPATHRVGEQSID